MKGFRMIRLNSPLLLATTLFALSACVGCETQLPPSTSAAGVTTVSDASPVDPNQTDVTPGAESSPAAEPESKKVELTDEQWREKLSAEEYRVLRQAGTERPFVNKYDHHFEPGAYACRACGQVLFESDTKFNSGCGWPAFYAAKAGDRVNLHEDLTHGMVRTEVTCARCDSHLGHVFDDAPGTPTGQRYCINSVSLEFIPKAKLPNAEAEKAGEAPEEKTASEDKG